MTASLYRTATEYVANEITITRGSVNSITKVGVFHTPDPTVVPAVIDFLAVQLVKPGDALAEGGKIDVLSLIGPRGGVQSLLPGDYQRWILVTTVSEDKIRRVDVLEVL